MKVIAWLAHFCLVCYLLKDFVVGDSRASSPAAEVLRVMVGLETVLGRENDQ